MVLATRCTSLMLAAAVMTAGVAGLHMEVPPFGGADHGGVPGIAVPNPDLGLTSNGVGVALLPEVGSVRTGNPLRHRLLGRAPLWFQRGDHTGSSAPHNRQSPAMEARARQRDRARRRTCPPEGDESAGPGESGHVVV